MLAVSGTPAVGKTTVSQRIARDLDALLVDLKEYALEKTVTERDDSRDTQVIDVDLLVAEFVRDHGGSEGRLVVDGSLSHFLPVTHVLVLRADPRLLASRMLERHYSREKVQENIEAEYAGVILHESCDLHENVLELDATSGVDTGVVTDWLAAGGRRLMDIDWSMEFGQALASLHK
ncbi:adenylate kinase family protein [Candidatus Altiarchaeota archaeon]